MTYRATQDYAVLHPRGDALQEARISEPPGANAVEGRLVLAPLKSFITLLAMGLTVAFAYQTFSFPNLALALGLTILFLWFGDSLGLHRLLIHRSFRCPLWLENVLATCGTLAGLGGPFDAIRIHDERDWAQRQPACHPFFAHQNNYLGDLTHQLFYNFQFDNGPIIDTQRGLENRPFLEWQTRYWWAPQLILATLLLPFGWAAVVWGVAVRLVISLVGHWTGVYLTHRFGETPHINEGDAVQGRNLPALITLITFGETLHNNHHAYPRSAKLNYTPNSFDLSYWAIQQLVSAGLAWNVLVPQDAMGDEIDKQQ